MARNKYTSTTVAVVLGIVVGVFVGGVLNVADLFRYDNYDKKEFIEPDVYQAVFLTNDQIYFGHLKSISSDYLILSDIYYVKVNEDGVGQLVKLGTGEPHGPQDKMIINQDQVLFWENLKPDSPVVKTIQSIEKK